MEDLNATIDALLDDNRPERYGVAERDWRQPVYDKIALLVPHAEARLVAARTIVDQREAQATRKANGLLREIGRSHEWPLDWLDLAAKPISVGDQRVQLQHGTAVDLDQWAIDERRVASQEHAARSQACDGAEWCASDMRARGCRTFAEAAR